MKPARKRVMTLAACTTLSALMAAPAMAQGPIALPSFDSAPEPGGSAMSAPSGGIPELSLASLSAPSVEPSSSSNANRFDGGLTVRQETRGEAFTPGSGSFEQARNPSFFERHTLAEDHVSVRTCLAAGEVCRAEFDVIMPISDESIYDPAILVNDEPVLLGGASF